MKLRWRSLPVPQGLVLPLVMAAILATLVVPLPSWLLDLGLGVNLAASAALLVAALRVRDPLEVTSFPTLLLITTLLRLGLNVSSTRLALAEGRAGRVIEAFGEFVVRGDYVVGTVVFAILALVQFLVVAKGAERVAEVSARFTLDGMPGKQMSIDADLRAGAIDQRQARARRRALERESQLFGAMDGAMKFVKGDVIAGLVIVVVNLLGGCAVGVFQSGMSLSDAAANYGLIALGDGLVSQIPSLCIAVAAGLLVTRVGAEQVESSLGAEVGRQFFGDATALGVASGLCLALGLLPGMPLWAFLALALLFGGGAVHRRGHPLQMGALAIDAGAPGSGAGEGEPPEQRSATPSVGVSPLTLDLAPDLSRWVQENDERFMREELPALKERVYQDLGVRVPGVRVRMGAPYLLEGGYALLVDEVPAGRGSCSLDSVYAQCPAEELRALGIAAEETADPCTGEPVARLPAEERSRLTLPHVRVRLAHEVLLDHLAYLLRRHAAQMLGLQEVQALLDQLEPAAPALVRSVLEKVPLALLAEVLRRLVQEEVSIRNLRAILEALAAPAAEGDAGQLAERCRQALHRYLSHKHAPSGLLYAHLVDPEAEQVLRDHAQKGAADPERVSELLGGLGRIAQEGRVVVLTSPELRQPLRRLAEGAFPRVAVLSYAELNPDQQIRPVGRLSLLRRAA